MTRHRTMRFRRAIAVLLTVAMVSTQTPLGYAADRVALGDQGQSGQAQSATAANVTADAAQEGTVDLSLSFDHAYVEVDGQTVSAPATKVSLPAGKDASVVAHADDGYSVSHVTLTSGTSSSTLAPEADGTYRISADQLAGGAALSVAATAQQSEQAATTAVPLDQQKKDEFTYEDDAVKVTAKLEKSGAIPADATLRVRQVQPSDGDYNYGAYLDALNKGAEASKKHNEKNTLLYDVAFLTRDADGNEVEVQPAEGSVNVSFEFKQGQISRELSADKASDVTVSHLPLADDARRSAKTTAEARQISSDDVTVETLTGSDVRAKGSDAIEVKTESLSVFALSYTVDFTYDGYSFSLPGEGSIKLGELFSALGISASAADATSVTFSNPDLVEVARDGSDWRLTSREPFLTREVLRVGMADGSTYVIDVTDAQTSTDLAAFLTDATIVAPTNDKGEYVVVPGTSYSFKLSFHENKSLQFPDDGRTMTYKLPQGLNADGHEGKFEVKVNDGGTVYTVGGNSYHITGDTLYLNLNTSDPNFSHLSAASNLAFTLSFEGSIAEDAKKIHFSDGVEKSVDVDTSNSVTASKSAVVNKDRGTVDYTVAIVSKGHSKNVKVHDRIEGSVLSLDASSVRATSNKGHAVDLKGGASGNTLDYTIPEMADGEVVTLTYSAKIDVSKIPVHDGKVITSGTNKVSVKSDGDPTPHDTEIHTTIDYTPDVSKATGTLVGENGHTKTLQWKIDANGEQHVSMANMRITDTIDEGSRQIMKYSGDGIQVKVIEGSNVVRVDNVPWSELAKKSDSEWAYVVPAKDAGHAYHYEITYTTDVDLTGKTGVTNVKNTVTTDGGKSSTAEGHPTPIGDNDVQVYKSAEKVDFENREISWKSDFTVPTEGLTDAVLTDYYPNQWYQKRLIIERANHDSIKVSGLLPGESYTVDYANNANERFGEDRCIITFYQDEAHITPGLRGGKQRTVTVELKTQISDELLEAAKTDQSREQRQNMVTLEVNGTTKTATAQTMVTTPAVSKKVQPWGTRKVGNSYLPIYKYEVVLARPTTDTETVYDEFDTSLLEPYETDDSVWDGSWYVFGGSTWSQSDRGGQFSHVMTDKGMRFDVPSDALPRDNSNGGALYDHYKLVYYLTVKDEAALHKLIDKSVNSPDHKAWIHNGVSWEDHTDGADIDYEYQALKKEMLTPESELSKTDEDVKAKFRVTLNPAGVMLNDGNPLTMTDTVDHLSVDPESIKASVPGVTWDVQGHTVTYKIPDATPVTIEYEAHVVFSEAAQAGETKSVTFSNKAEMSGYKQDVEKTAYRKNSGTATASVPSVKLLKYEAGNMGERLGGATFALLDEHKQPVEGNSGAVTFTTKADGTATIRGDQAGQGWTLDEGKQYYLRETHAPQGHMLTGDDIPFKITLDGTSDPDHGIYEMGDTLTVKNYPGTDVHVEKSWSDGSGRHGSDSVVVRLQQRIAGGDWSDTIREHVGDADSAWTDTPAKDLTISAGTNWEGSFKNLPLAVPASLSDPDADDVSVEYRVIETQVNGKAPEEGTSDVKVVPPSSEDGSYLVKVTNTPKVELTEASVNKVWDDADNQDGKRPGEVKVTLTANGARTEHTETLSEGNNWSAKVADLPKTDDAGHEIDYAWVEDSVPDGYAVSGTTKDGTVTTITNRHVPEKTSATVNKAWADADNQDGKRPQEISVDLLANGKTVRTVTLSEKGGWTQTVGDLPAYEGGKKIEYAWSEESLPDGYELGGSATSGTVTTITNRHTPETVGTKVQKVWDDADDLEGFRPKTIDVELRAGSRVVRTATLSAENDWSASAEGLPKYEGGHEVAYSWAEKGVPSGYQLSTSVEGDTTTLTNTHTPETTSASVKKVWVDDNNQDGKRPQSITVTLTANGKKTDRTVTLSDDNGWSATLDGLQKYQGGEAVTYGWSEDALPDGYELTGDVTDAGVTTLTNSRGSEKTEATVHKVWADADNQDGKRPSEIRVTLTANGQKTDRTVTLSAANNWTAKVDGLDRNKDGRPIAYAWDEGDAPAGYKLTNTATTGTVTTLTNTHEVEKTKASVKKVWADAENQDGKRPAAIVVTLQKKVGGADWTDATLSGATVQRTLSADNDWSASVDELPAFEGGQKVAYGWAEKDVPDGYKLTTDTKDGATTLTNTHEVEKTEATVRKVWADANNQDGKRPSEIKVTLAANGKATDHTVSLSDANGWTATVSDLPAFAGGQKVTYTWSEDALPAGYAISGTANDGTVTTITNKHDTETTGASVHKVWVDANNQDGARPASIVVTLQKSVGGAAATDVTADGKPVERTLSADNWSASVDGLPAFEDGQKVAYSWVEKSVPSGYTLATDTKGGTTTLTNTHEVEKTEATVRKVWDDANDQDGKRPASIKVALLADGTRVDEVTLDAKNGWSATVSGLNKYQGGKEIVYTWSEEALPQGYALSGTANEGTVTTLTNKHDVEKTKATVKKVWDDADNQDGIRPSELKVRLSSGQEVTLNDGNGWSATVDDLPVYAGGQNVHYTWSEAGLPAGYKLTKSETDGELTTITNTHEVEKTEASVKKVWDDANDQDGKRPSSINVALLANGEKVDEVTLDASNGWSAKVSNLDKKAAGNDIAYTWAEGDAPAGYKLVSNATEGTVTTLTNKHDVEKTSLSVKKVWDDADNQDGKRPGELKVALKAGDAKVGEVTLNDANHWSAEIGDLPVFAGGERIDYAWSEEALPQGYALSGTATEGAVTTLTNTHEPETTGASVRKVWNDANDQDGKRPESIVVTLQKSVDGAAATDVTADGKPVERTLSADNWSASVDGLPKYEGGKLVAYSWVEKSVPSGYQLAADTKDGATTLTNTHEVEKTEATVRKVWDDANNQDGKRPATLEVALLANGKESGQKVTLSDANGWKAKVEGLDKYQGGKEVAYTWSEASLPEGYSLTGEASAAGVTTLTNSYKPEQTSATVRKAWDDANDQDGMRPESIKVTLLADGEPTEHTATLSQENKWTATVSGLDKMRDGRAISYTWREDEVPEGYAATTATEGTTTTITNTHEPAKTEASVRKVWDDDSSAGAHRPQSLDVHLLANGQQAKDASGADIVARLDQSNNWSATVRDLPANARGVAIAYTWREGDVPAGYKLVDEKSEAGVTTITNAYDASAKLSFKGTKHMSGRPFVAGDDYTFTVTVDDAKAPLPERPSVRIAPTTGETAALDFGDVSFTLADAGKTYTYTVTESGSAAGVTNAAAKTVKVSVADAGDGTLRVTTVEGDAAKLDFTNTYEATGTLELKGTKSMEGRELAEGDHFEFDVAERGGKTVTVGNTGSKIDYPTLSYTLADLGTHTYTVSEHKVDKDGVKSDGRTYTLVVTVADEVRDGKLEVTSAGADPQGLDFKNTYDATGAFPLEARKTIEGRDFGAGSEADRYTFTVTSADAGAPMPERASVTIEPTSGREAAVDFGSIDFKLADAGKTFTYTVTESGKVAGVTNASAKTVTLKVTDDGQGRLKVERTGGDELPLAFDNTYDASGTATVQATKSLSGRAWKAGETYAFTLSARPGTPMPERTRAVATAQGTPADFGPISYTLADAGKTFDYTIAEVLPTDASGKTVSQKDGVTYDTETHAAHVKVTDAGDGTLATEVTYDDGAKSAPTFANDYGATGSVDLTAIKRIENREFSDLDSYTFTVTADAANPGAPMPEHPSVTINPREGHSTTVEFGKIAYTLDDAGKTFSYDVTESGTVAGVTNDARTHRVQVRVSDAGDGTLAVEKSYLVDGKAASTLTFSNDYEAAGSYELHATKTMVGRDFNEGDSYTFTVTPDGVDAPMPERSSVTIEPREGSQADVDFGKIDYTLANAGKAYTYTISESGTVAGVTNDVRTRTVTVKVSDNGDGTLSCTDDTRIDGVPSKQALTFANRYAATGEATIDAHKTLEGRDLKAGEFTFELVDETGAVLQSATNAADGTVAFKPIAYDLASLGSGDSRAKSRTFSYKVREKLPAGVDADHARQDGMTYDTNVRDVSVTVTDDGRGNLETKVDYGQGKTAAEFKNTYFSATETLDFEKHYYGADKNALFDFELTAADDSWKPRTGDSGTVEVDAARRDSVVDSGQAFKVVARNGSFDESGTAKVELPKLVYFEPGTYRYVLAESHDKAASNDAAEYHVTVTVAPDQTASRTVELVSGDATTNVDSMAFYNNDQVTLGFNSSPLAPQDDRSRQVSVDPKAKKVFDNGTLVSGEFAFSLRDASGCALQTATNDALGTVTFDRVLFDAPGTYDFTLTEDPGSDAGIVYDTHAIGYRVTVTADEKGVLSAKETYLGPDGKPVDEATFVNDVRTIEIRGQKRSREAPYDPLPGATYGICMANANGNDVYMGSAVSDADGYLRYEVPTTQGVAYYLREEKAPHGHLVDPYPTDYFTIGKGTNGAYYLVYQYDSEFFALVPDLKGRI